MIKKLASILNPNQYQGWGKTRNYFEGWYFKLVSADERNAIAIIPGVAMDRNGIQQSFIQLLDGKNKTAEYHKFSIDDFTSESDKFEVRIAENLFSTDTIQLNLPGLKGCLKFSELTPWPRTWYSPGIMGPFSFFPFMECYHGVLSLNHCIEGELIMNDVAIDFSDGCGYIEKDWGHSFPSAYYWLQTNHFNEKGVSLISSVANIPWLGSSFVGFIGGIWFRNQLIQFTTYNGSKLLRSFANMEQLELIFENKAHRLEIVAKRDLSTKLASPIAGFMDGRIEECMTSETKVMLFDRKKNELIFSDTARNTTLEIAGKIEDIMVIAP